MKANEIFMRDIKFHKVENAMEQSSEEAPYLGVVESAGTIDTEAFAEEMIEDGCTETKETIIRMIESGDSAIMTCVGEHLMKVYTGDGSLVSPYIYGAFDAPDAPVGPNNAVEPQIRLGTDLRDAVSDIVPVEDRSVISTLGGVRIFSVMTEDLGFGIVKGTDPFSIAGSGFKPSETSTVAVSLVSKKTGLATAATVISVDSTQRIKAKMPTALAAGAYTVVATVTDGTKVRSGNRGVTVLAGETPVPPTITKVTQEGREDNVVVLHGTSACTIIGTNLALAAGDAVKIQFDKDGTLYDTGVATVESSTATTINITGFTGFDSSKYSEWVELGADTKIIVGKSTGTATQAVQFMIGA